MYSVEIYFNNILSIHQIKMKNKLMAQYRKNASIPAEYVLSLNCIKNCNTNMFYI